MRRVLVFNPSTPSTFRKSNHLLYQIYIIFFYVSTSLLIAFFGLSLHKVLKKSQQKFAAQLLGLMLASNVTILVSIYTYELVIRKVNNGEELSSFYWFLAAVALICFVASNALYNIAAWILSFHYFMCS